MVLLSERYFSCCLHYESLKIQIRTEMHSFSDTMTLKAHLKYMVPLCEEEKSPQDYSKALIALQNNP